MEQSCSGLSEGQVTLAPIIREPLRLAYPPGVACQLPEIPWTTRSTNSWGCLPGSRVRGSPSLPASLPGQSGFCLRPYTSCGSRAECCGRCALGFRFLVLVFLDLGCSPLEILLWPRKCLRANPSQCLIWSDDIPGKRWALLRNECSWRVG
jgi:hypothetical protein